jgi:hypothetical protein
MDLFFSKPDTTANQVDLEPCMSIDRWGIFRITLGVSQRYSQAGHELRNAERFGQVIISAGIQRPHLLKFLTTG